MESEKEKEASAIAPTPLTARPARGCIPGAEQPAGPWLLAHQRRPKAGAETTPVVMSGPSRSAIKVAQTGTPRTKFLVPSIGSMIH